MVSLICENDGIMNRINLEKRSFYNAKKLNEINITAASNIYFGSGCFEGSKMPKSVSLVSKDISIGDNCFTECNSLQSFVVSEIENIEIAEKVSIGEKCFANLQSLTDVNIIANEINFGKSCFSGSKKLENVSLFSIIKTIDDNCPNESNSSESFKISEVFPEKINFADECFFNTQNLQDIEITANDINLGKNCFSGSKKLQKAVLHGDICLIHSKLKNCQKEKT